MNVWLSGVFPWIFQLAKFLPPQLYNSIFTGRHTTRVAAKRKKLTIFLSDIANFTETTNRLESEEQTTCSINI